MSRSSSRHRMFRILAVGLIVSLAAAGSVMALEQAHPAMLRVFHASPDAPRLDVVVDGVGRVASGVSYGALSDRASLPAGFHHVSVVPEGDSPLNAVAEVDLNALYDHRYLLVVSGLKGRHQLLPVQLPVGCPMMNRRTQIRVLQAAPLGAAVDVRVEDGPYLYRNIEYGEVSDCLVVPAGRYQLEVVDADFTWNTGSMSERTELGPGNAYVLVIGPAREAPERLVHIWALPMLGGGHGLGQPSR